MNSTDKEKRAILAMFEEPIEEVEMAFLEHVNSEVFSQEYYKTKTKLHQKITALKLRLPTVQGGE